MVLLVSVEIKVFKAVPPISACWPSASSVPASAIRSDMESPAASPIAPIRFTTSTIGPAEARLVWDISLIAEPVASKAFSTPSFCVSPRMAFTFISWRTASAPPKSSPNATSNWLPAFTNPNTSSLAEIPNLPASYARSWSSCCAVRVSILSISRLSSATDSVESPVVFSMSARLSLNCKLAWYNCLIRPTTSLNPAYTST